MHSYHISVYETVNNQTFDAAISLMHGKTAYKFRPLKSIWDSLTQKAALLFAKLMILPYFDYGC